MIFRGEFRKEKRGEGGVNDGWIKGKGRAIGYIEVWITRLNNLKIENLKNENLKKTPQRTLVAATSYSVTSEQRRHYKTKKSGTRWDILMNIYVQQDEKWYRIYERTLRE